jgi:FeS assembly SUF system regulator
VRLTKLADYAIVLLTRFAAGGTGAVHAARDLAAETHIPFPTVGKLLKALAHAGFLRSHRGVRGGYSLARAPDAITVAQVITAFEGPIAVTECLGEPPGTCEIELLCPVRSTWGRINAAVRSALDGLTLQELAAPAFPLRRSPEPVTGTTTGSPT